MKILRIISIFFALALAADAETLRVATRTAMREITEGRSLSKQYADAVLSEICEPLGYELEFSALTGRHDTATLYRENYEVVSTVFKTPEVLEYYNVAREPLGSIHVGLYARRDSPLRGTFKSRLYPDWPRLRVVHNNGPLGGIHRFERFARENGLEYEFIPVDSTGDGDRLIAEGLADVWLFASYTVNSNLEEIASLGEENWFFAVTKKRPDVFAALDRAYHDLAITNRDFLARAKGGILGAKESAKRRVVMGVYNEPGMFEMDEDGTFDGAAKRWADSIGSLAGWEYDLVYSDYPDLIDHLVSGEIDLLVGVARTPEREGKIYYPPIALGFYRPYIFAPKDSPYVEAEPATWKGIRIGFPGRASGLEELQGILDAAKIYYEIHIYHDLDESLAALERGEVDAIRALDGRAFSDWKVLTPLRRHALYAAASMKRPDLQQELVAAVEGSKAMDLTLDARLQAQFLTSSDTKLLDYTPKEYASLSAFRQSGHSVRIELFPLEAPYKGYDAKTGRASGFAGSLFREMSSRLKVHYDFHASETIAEARRRFIDGETDMWFSLGADLRGLNDYGVPIDILRIPPGPELPGGANLHFFVCRGVDAEFIPVLIKVLHSFSAEELAAMYYQAVIEQKGFWTTGRILSLIALFVFVALVWSLVVAAAHNRKLVVEREKVLKAEKAKSYFFSTVSHDLRTPLNAICGFAELLARGVGDAAEVKKYLGSILSSSRVLLQLVNDILDLSKLEAGKMVIRPEPTDIHRIVDEIIAACTVSASAKGLALEHSVDFSDRLELDPQRIRQILFNFVGNAIKFTEKGKVEIKFRLFSASDPKRNAEGYRHLVFSVADTGCGIAAKDIGSITNPYVQAGHGGRHGGTGLGLAICRELVKGMAGELVIESTVGKGSVFTVSLPGVKLAPAEAPVAPVVTAAPAAKDDFSLLSVLSVDDSKVNLAVLRAFLKRLGVKNIIEAGNGREALARLAETTVDVVLSDLWMPELNGEGLVKAIRAGKHSNLPVYAISADVEAVNAAAGLGFSGFLLKPFAIEELKKILEAVAAAKPPRPVMG